MNPQGVSETGFERTYRMPADQTAQSPFARVPVGVLCSQTLLACLATGSLIAIGESICIREMRQHVDPGALQVALAIH